MFLRPLLFPLLGLVALLSSARAIGYDERATIDLTHALAADGSVTISNVNGDIEIRTWDRAEIHIEGEKRAKSADDLSRIEITQEFRPDHAEFKVKLPKKKSGWFGGGGTIDAQVDLVVTVPATADLASIRTVNGTLTVTGTTGRLNASTVNGRIEATDLAGDAVLKTVNGRVRADFTAVAPDADLTFETVNGGITLSLPRDTNAQVSSSVVNGHVETALPITLNGRVSRKKLEGTFGNGGARLKASTVNGSIEFLAHDS